MSGRRDSAMRVAQGRESPTVATSADGTTTTGRTLDESGQPRPETGFELRRNGELAALLARRTGALMSHPTRGVWSAPLPEPEGETDVLRSVGIYEPGFDGPPEHYHTESEERFEVLAGEITFHVDGRDERVTAGETLTVEPNERHTFTVTGDALCYVLVEIRSPGRLRHVLPTLFGVAHDDGVALTDPLQGALIADRLADNTVFTEVSPTVAQPLSAALAPVARFRGYQGAYARYTRDAFWERHVEQPDA